MTAPIGAGWKVGDKVFCVKGTNGFPAGHKDYRENGYIVTITAATPARVKVGDRTWTRDGRRHGGDWRQGYLRPLMDGDDARDAAWREKVRAANEEKRRNERADRLGHLDWREWRKLPADQVGTIHGWLADVGVKA